MADYKGIKGFKIQSVSSDPSNLTKGQIWYNSTSGVVKGRITGVASWSATNSINTARYAGGSAGTNSTTAMFFGGQSPPGSYTFKVETEQYNGTSWSEVGDMNSARRNISGFGTQSDAMGVGGYAQHVGQLDYSETWNGTSWSEGNNLGSSRDGCASGGHSTSSAGLVFGGWDEGPALASTKTETYNGTSWSEVNDLATATVGSGGAGTQAAALSIYTYGPPSSGLSSRWDGTSWTTDGGTLNTSRNYGTQHGGTQISALYAGGPGSRTITEVYDGTSWTEMADLAVGRGQLGGAAANNTAALAFGGNQDPPAVDASEEWSTPDQSTVTVTAS
jgi:hypothetical protein